MSERSPDGSAELRRTLYELRDRAIRFPGWWWETQFWPGKSLRWRVLMTTERIDRHEVALKSEDYPMPDDEWTEVIASLPTGYGVIHVDRRDDEIEFFARLGRVRERCHRCGEAMDETARAQLAETCSGCALERGELVMGAGWRP
ncbi:MAG TPA: hypothetical protein VF158_10830 [Longimicrobiales bacterium]